MAGVLDDIVAALDGCAGISDAVRADAVSESTLIPSTVLVTLLDPIFSNEVYALVLDKSPTYPNVVYHRVSSERIKIDNHEILRSDTYVLTIRAEEYPDLLTKFAAVKTALLNYSSSGEVGSFEIDDVREEYDHELDVFLIGMEVKSLYLTSSSQAENVVHVYLEGAAAQSDDMANITRQLMTEGYALIIACNSSNLETIRGEIEDCLLGFVPPTLTNGYTMDYAGGGQVETFGHITIFKELYNVYRTIRDDD